MEITFDVLSQIPRLFKEIVAIIQEPLDKQRDRRKEFFDTEIKPIHDTMVAINEDYTKSFEELLELLTEDRDLPRALQLLKKRRLILLAKRKEAEAFAEILKTVKGKGYLKKRVIVAFIEFSERIKAYMQSASPVDQRFSWYSGFINEFETIMKRGDLPSRYASFASISASQPVDLVRKAYEEAVQKDIPEAWMQYMKAYQKLKLELHQ